MATIASHTIVKNGAEYIEPVLRRVLPLVNRGLVYLDVKSTDGTKDILERLQKEYDNLAVVPYSIKEPFKELVGVRNLMIKETWEDWIWIVDDDEYYPLKDAEKALASLGNEKVYAISYWFVIDNENYHPFRSKVFAPRFFRNDGRKWQGVWGKDKLQTDHDKIIKIRGAKYIHFSYTKKSSWRKDFAPKRVYSEYNEGLPLPIEICTEIKRITS